MYDKAIRLAAIHLDVDESIIDKNYQVVEEVEAIYYKEQTGKKRSIIINNEGVKIISPKPVELSVLVEEFKQKRNKE